MLLNPLVSIVVPIYKVPETLLRNCIESLIGQSLRNIEIILVDDGSPDKCGKICDEYKDKDERIRVIHKVNGGLAAARNSGQDQATGKTLMFLDGDDYLESNCCELTYDALVANDAELVMFNQFTNYPNSQVEIQSFEKDESRLFVKEECKKLQARVLDFNGKIAMAFMKLIRLDYLRKNNIRHVDELRQGAEGFVFNIQLFEHLTRAYYLNKPLLHYVYNGQSISHSSSAKNNEYIVRCMEWIDDYIQNKSENKNLHTSVLNRMLYVVCTTAVTGCFNPSSPLSYLEKVLMFENFLSHELVQDAIQNAPREGLNKQRRFILYLVEKKCFRLISLLGWMRKKQLEHR